MDTVLMRDPVEAKGFTIVPNSLLRHPSLKAPEKIVYQLLLSYAFGKDNCFPGQERLAYEAGDLSVDRVRAYLKSLRDKGFISWTKTNTSPPHNVYYIESLHTVAFMREPVNPVEMQHSNPADSQPLNPVEMRPKEDQSQEDDSKEEEVTPPASVPAGRKRRFNVFDTEQAPATEEGRGKAAKEKAPKLTADDRYKAKKLTKAYADFTAAELLRYFSDRYQEIKGVKYVADHPKEIRLMTYLIQWVSGAAKAVEVIEAYFTKKGPNAMLSAGHFSKEFVKELASGAYKSDAKQMKVREVKENEQAIADNAERIRELLGD